MTRRDTLIRYLVGVAFAVGGLVSGYYAAYTGLKVELATKAESHSVGEIDLRLARMEAMLGERFATKDDLAAFKNEIVARLTVIETKLGESRTQANAESEMRKVE